MKITQLFSERLTQSCDRLSAEQYNDLFQNRLEFGSSLLKKILLPALGNNDFALLEMPGLFGLNGRETLNQKLPLVLSFGYDIGAGFYEQIYFTGKRKFEISSLCALFNAGISVFDRITDYSKQIPHIFQSVFNEKILIDLIENKDASLLLMSKANHIIVPELRLTMKMISIFFINLHKLSEKRSNQPEWEKLNMMLISAFRAQIETASASACEISSAQDSNFALNAENPKYLLSLAEKKSTLPFLIMAQLTLSFESRREYKSSMLQKIANVTANLFWHLDDLVDLHRDQASGDINANLLKNKNGITEAIIHSEMEEIFSIWAELKSLLRDNEYRKKILFYIQNWMK